MNNQCLYESWYPLVVILIGGCLGVLRGWFNEPKKNPIKCDKPKFDQLKTKEIHPEFYGKLTRQERRAITPQGFARAFFEANR